MNIAFDQLEKGQSVGERTVPVSRADLVKYAGASGDFNPIHWNQDFAQNVGLPNVIAHGMFTMGAAVGLVTEWAGDAGASSITKRVSPSPWWCPTVSTVRSSRARRCP